MRKPFDNRKPQANMGLTSGKLIDCHIFRLTVFFGAARKTKQNPRVIKKAR
jgi:hypothetical protein